MLYFVGKDTVPSQVSLSAGESMEMTLVILPGVSAQVPVHVDLNGEGASLKLSGMYLCGNDEDVRLDIRVNHNASRTESVQLFNGIAGGHSRAAFDGRIKVVEGVAQVKALQENHNILLSTDATVQTSPQLEIYSDDVECSHGATTGFLNIDEQFYMRSRGIPEAEAKVFQMVSFLSPVLDTIKDEELKTELLAKVVDILK